MSTTIDLGYGEVSVEVYGDQAVHPPMSTDVNYEEGARWLLDLLVETWNDSRSVILESLEGMGAPRSVLDLCGEHDN